MVVVVAKWSVISPYSDDPSSNSAEVYNFFVKLLLKITKINKKRPELSHLKKVLTRDIWWRFPDHLQFDKICRDRIHDPIDQLLIEDVHHGVRWPKPDRDDADAGSGLWNLFNKNLGRLKISFNFANSFSTFNKLKRNNLRINRQPMVPIPI